MRGGRGLDVTSGLGLGRGLEVGAAVGLGREAGPGLGESGLGLGESGLGLGESGLGLGESGAGPLSRTLEDQASSMETELLICEGGLVDQHSPILTCPKPPIEGA